MRTRWLAMGLGALLALSACSNGKGGGGGGKAYEPTHDRSNPVTREQETQDKALPLQAIPNRRDNANGDVVDDAKVAVVSEDGRAEFQVDVNHASRAELMRVPGMSANLAAAIVNNKPYRNADDMVRRIPNLDKRLVTSMQPYLAFGAAGQKGSQ